MAVKFHKKTSKKVIARYKRAKRIRKKIFGTADKPRLSVFRSLAHIYAQLIDDENGRTLVAFSTLHKEFLKDEYAKKTKSEKAFIVGKILAQKALEKNITTVVFDRSGYLYHGRVKKLADGAREGGLKF